MGFPPVVTSQAPLRPRTVSSSTGNALTRIVGDTSTGVAAFERVNTVGQRSARP